MTAQCVQGIISMDDETVLMSGKPLQSGYTLDCYKILDVLGQGGFGITYRALDMSLDREVAIKEYLPTSFAFRHQDYSVRPMTGNAADNFSWGLDNFLKEAKTLAKFNHRNIVRVHTVFELHSTAYMVMEYERGQSLASIFNHKESASMPFLKSVFFPIFDGLSNIHKLDFIHRDIKPSNIYIRQDGSPVLIDFGSARLSVQDETSELTSLVSQGYTPLEQYSADYGKQGPWTDIYSLAATIYQGIKGIKPVDAISRSAHLLRSQPDHLRPLNVDEQPGFDQSFLDAVHQGLVLQPENRPQSLQEWALSFGIEGSFSGDHQVSSEHENTSNVAELGEWGESQETFTWTNEPDVAAVASGTAQLGYDNKKGIKKSRIAGTVLTMILMAGLIFVFLSKKTELFNSNAVEPSTELETPAPEIGHSATLSVAAQEPLVKFNNAEEQEARFEEVVRLAEAERDAALQELEQLRSNASKLADETANRMRNADEATQRAITRAEIAESAMQSRQGQDVDPSTEAQRLLCEKQTNVLPIAKSYRLRVRQTQQLKDLMCEEQLTCQTAFRTILGTLFAENEARVNQACRF